VSENRAVFARYLETFDAVLAGPAVPA
jgi:hypothetical protein